MIAEVIVDVISSAVDKVFDYILPSEFDARVGQMVKVPFGRKNVEGFIINIKETSTFGEEKLKCVFEVLQTQPSLSENMVKLCFFMKKHFFIRMIDAIRLCLPPIVRNGKVKQKLVKNVALAVDEIPPELQKSPKQLEIVLYLKEKGSVTQNDITNKFSASSLKTLIQKGFVKVFEIAQERTPQNAFSVAKKQITLNVQQQKAANILNNSKYNTYLLNGVTGSGKTEVYISAIKHALSKGKTAIMLVPEISLTPQMFARFRNAFGDTVAILHSLLSQGERFDEWNRLREGRAKIAIGARSAIFAPLDNLGIIIIDEEHDGSYYSESNPRFHTHEVAQYLAYLSDCPLVLGSATPSVVSSYKVKIGEYKLLTLTERANKKELPQIEIVDMLSEIRNGNSGIFSTKFLAELDKCIKDKKQAMIFLNRRGFSSFVMCRNCGYVPKCEDCDVSLVYHKEDDMLKCHYCNRRYRALTKCPKCASPSIRFGAVGTQRVVEELSKHFSVPIFRLDNDSTQNKNAYIEILQKFNSTSPSILVGTQMIAKGHDFNNVSFVGIVDADVSLHFSDYRAIERTYQLITQVSGRAGRSDSEGKVVLQTYYPKHFAYRCACTYDYDAFLKKELNLRETTHFPPYVDILRVLVLSENEQKAEDTLHKIFVKIKDLRDSKYTSDFSYLGAMKCPRKRLQKNYRFQIMIRIYEKNAREIIENIYKICDEEKANKVSIFVENDPQNLS